MKITAIKQQIKQRDRYSVYVDDKYTFSLSEGALLESRIASGQELTPEQVNTFKQLSADDKIYNRALRYAAMRTRSHWEMESYLQRKDASPALIEQITNKLETIGLLDDRAFAGAWVANRRLLKPVSRRRLIQELRHKRVADDIIQEVLAEDETDERSTLRELVERKRKQSKYADDTKLMQYLARQGFSYDDIKAALQSPED